MLLMASGKRLGYAEKWPGAEKFVEPSNAFQPLSVSGTLPKVRWGSPSQGGVNSLDKPGVALIKWLLCPVVITLTLFASVISHNHPVNEHYELLAILAFLTSAHVFDEINLYRTRSRFPLFKALNTILIKWSVVIGILLLVAFATKLSTLFSRSVILSWFAVTPFTLVLMQAITRALLHQLIAKSEPRKAVIVGGNQLGYELYNKINSDGYLGIKMDSFFDDRSPDRLPSTVRDRLKGTMDEVVEYVHREGIDLLYISLPMSSQPRIQDLLTKLHDTTASIYFVPDIFMFDLIQARFDQINGVPVVAICDTPFYGVRGVLKRASDILLSSVILLLILPLLLPIALGVKGSSPGPVFFRQRRYGLDGEEIAVYKFRTMTVCEDGDSVIQAQREDQRITPFGRFLRKTSLDELPQFINVLQGRMSIVGPRPHAVVHNEVYRKVIKGYMIRHKVKPGITGLAQVSGLRGETETLDKMRARIEHDLEYLRHWSLGLDFWIMLKTVKVVLGDRGAY